MSSTNGNEKTAGLTLSADDLEVVQRIRDYLAANEKACPCCMREPETRYKRSINGEWCRFLKRMVELYAQTKTWVHVREIFDGNKASTDGTYFRHWKLIEPKPRKRAELSSGFWKPTQDGIDFVAGVIEVRSHVVLVKNQVVEWSSEWVYFKDCVDKEFQIDDVLSERS